MPKVLFLIDTLNFGGAERSLVEIVLRLQDTTPLVYTAYKAESPLWSELRKENIELGSLGLQGKYQFVKGIRKLRKVIQHHQPQLVVASLFRSEIIARIACQLEGVPSVGSFVNDSYSPLRFEKLSFPAKVKLRVVQLVDLLTARMASAYYANTSVIAESNRKHLYLGSHPIRTIYRGRVIDKYSNPEHSERTGPFLFLSTARLLWRKGYKELIEAVTVLKESDGFKVLIAGDGVNSQEIKEEVRRQGVEPYFDFLGWRADIPSLLTKAHAFVLPSHYEGIGGGAIEAMLANRPIILSDIPVFIEVAGEHASFFRMGDSMHFANQMEEMMEKYGEAQKKAEAALEFARKRYDIKKVAREHEDFYQEVIESGKKKIKVHSA